MPSRVLFSALDPSILKMTVCECIHTISVFQSIYDPNNLAMPSLCIVYRVDMAVYFYGIYLHSTPEHNRGH